MLRCTLDVSGRGCWQWVALNVLNSAAHLARQSTALCVLKCTTPSPPDRQPRQRDLLRAPFVGAPGGMADGPIRMDPTEPVHFSV